MFAGFNSIQDSPSNPRHRTKPGDIPKSQHRKIEAEVRVDTNLLATRNAGCGSLGNPACCTVDPHLLVAST